MKLLLISSSKPASEAQYLGHVASVIPEFLGKETRQVLFIPYAQSDYLAYTRLVRERFSGWGHEGAGLTENSDPKRAINEAPAIFVGGGNTFRLLARLYELNLLDPIREKILAGTPYLGASAGINITGPTIGTTNDMPILYPPSLRGLGLLSFNLNPHYFDPIPGMPGESRAQRLKEFSEENDEPVVALKERAYLLIEGKKILLKGDGAKIFKKGVGPKDYPPGSDLAPAVS